MWNLPENVHSTQDSTVFTHILRVSKNFTFLSLVGIFAQFDAAYQRQLRQLDGDVSSPALLHISLNT